MNNDPHDYLKRMGLPKHVTKAGERSAKGLIQSSPFPARNNPETAPNDRKLPVGKKAIGVSGSTRGVGSLGSSSESGTGKAKTAKIEGNESSQYEAMEKKSLKSMKGGGSEKELRAGHNTRGKMPKVPSSPKAKAKMEKTMHEFKVGGLHSGSKKGPMVTNRKQAIAIGLSQARKA